MSRLSNTPPSSLVSSSVSAAFGEEDGIPYRIYENGGDLPEGRVECEDPYRDAEPWFRSMDGAPDAAPAGAADAAASERDEAQRGSQPQTMTSVDLHLMMQRYLAAKQLDPEAVKKVLEARLRPLGSSRQAALGDANQSTGIVGFIQSLFPSKSEKGGPEKLEKQPSPLAPQRPAQSVVQAVPAAGNVPESMMRQANEGPRREYPQCSV